MNLADAPEENLPDPGLMNLADRWILSRHQRVVETVNGQLEH